MLLPRKGSQKILKSSQKTIKSSEKTFLSKEKILKLIADNPNTTTKQLSEITGLSSAGIEKNIRQMKENGLIRRVGPDKGGHWKVIEK